MLAPNVRYNALNKAERQRIDKLVRGDFCHHWMFYGWDCTDERWVSLQNFSYIWTPGQVLVQYEPRLGLFHFHSAFVVESVVEKGDVTAGGFRYVSETYPPLDEENDLRQVTLKGLISLTQFPRQAILEAFFMGIKEVRYYASVLKNRAKDEDTMILKLKDSGFHYYEVQSKPFTGRESGRPIRKRKRRKKT